MKKTLVFLALAIPAILLVGCSAGQTSQNELEKDAQKIQLDPDATPVDSGAVQSNMPRGGK